MDRMARYNVQYSIKDVLNILDSAPIHNDLISNVNIAQLTNRAPIAHLAIERGIKALISNSGETVNRIHDLNRLYRDLSVCDKESANYLSSAFDDAVRFFGYDVVQKGFRHFRSLDSYLSKVGTGKGFEALRYWVLGETTVDESPIPYISPPIHREILYALWCLFRHNRRETVSERVEREVAHSLFYGRHITCSSEDTRKKCSISWYMNWLTREHSSNRSALEVAVKHRFEVKEGDDFVSKTLRDAYTELQQSKDPAVVYYISTLTYLPKGSQRKNPDSMPVIEWFGKRKRSAGILTPAGTPLGFLDWLPDGGWAITPSESGLVQVSDVAKSLGDAKHYLVNRLTTQVMVTINTDEAVPLRIVNKDHLNLPNVEWTSDEDGSTIRAMTYQLEFWDDNHGLRIGDDIIIESPFEGSNEIEQVIEGTIEAVEKQSVTIRG